MPKINYNDLIGNVDEIRDLLEDEEIKLDLCEKSGIEKITKKSKKFDDNTKIKSDDNKKYKNNK